MKNTVYLITCLMAAFSSSYCVAEISISESLSRMSKSPTDDEIEKLVEILKKHNNVATAIVNKDYKSALFLLDYVDESSNIDYLLVLFTWAIHSKNPRLNDDQIELMYKIIDKGMFNANSYTSFLGTPTGFYKKDTFHTLLSLALHFGQYNVFNTLLEAGADINAQQGCVLTHAIESRDIEKLRMVLESGACLETLDPLWVQTKIEATSDLEIIKLLRDHGVAFDWWRLLNRAIFHNKLDVIKFILESHDACVKNRTLPENRTVVYDAVRFGDCDTLNYILDYGFNLVDGNSETFNYLANAIRQLDVKKVRFLLERGVDTSIKVDGLVDILNFTLSLRTWNLNEETKKDEILRILIKHGVELS